MNTINKLFVLLFLGVFTTSCLMTGVIGSRNVTTENREINDNFTGIKVSQGIEVLLTQDTDVSFSAEMDDNLHELLITEVEDGVLKIFFEKNVSKRKSSKVYLSMPKISSIKTSSGSEVDATNTLKVNDLNLDASSGSEIDLRVDANSIESESSSGSEINLKGTCISLRADSSSGSEIDADELRAETVNAKASSGSDIDVYASKSIDAKASSGASINCAGNPEEKNFKKSSGGDVDIY